jgi:hypothetical protein
MCSCQVNLIVVQIMKLMASIVGSEPVWFNGVDYQMMPSHFLNLGKVRAQRIFHDR